MRFCVANKGFGEYRFTGARNTKELAALLGDDVMIRRLKINVLPDLPPKIRSVKAVKIRRMEEYQRAEDDLIGWLHEVYGPLVANRAVANERFARFVYLRQYAAKLKMKQVYAFIDRKLKQGGKILVGTIHRKTTARLYRRYSKIAVVIEGATSRTQRERAEKYYRNNPKCRMLIGQIKAAGEALNLPETKYVIFVELPWNPATCVQFEDRAHRLTTKHKVYIYYLIAEGTIEETLVNIIDRKMKILHKILDGGMKEITKLEIFDMLQAELLKKAG
jgi:SWI/SNF-related matrix-associated actin-dependent regulator 1 of chromatin subfamily A